MNETVIQTNGPSQNGQAKCPSCGATDIATNTQTGMLRCNFCRYEFAPEKVSGLVDDLTTLEGRVIASGAQNIVADTNEVLTFKCSSCGAEVVIDTASAVQARCHWCRNTLSVNEQMPNGAIPDAVLPFNVTQADAKQIIEKFVGGRKFFAHPAFRKEFTTENIMGVYFPYMVIDINAQVSLSGQGEKTARRFTRGFGKKAKTYYDADLYDVGRNFDLTVHGLTIEGNSERRSNQSGKTNNIINAIMPFDIENCVRYNANFLKGYTSERRDTNVEELTALVTTQAQDVARHAANQSVEIYDRGVRWDHEQFQARGEQWQAAYLPVWLYSYQQKSSSHSTLHYVAVNARTREVMGSVPIYLPKLIGVSLAVEAVGIIAMLFVDFKHSWLFALSGIIFYFFFYLKYRNTMARHTYETDTKTEVANLRQRDEFVRHLSSLENPQMLGANNHSTRSAGVSDQILNAVTNPNGNIISTLTDGNPLANILINKLKK